MSGQVEGMSEPTEDLPEAVGGVEGESDVVAERAGCEARRTRRPVPADLPDELDHEPGEARAAEERRAEERRAEEAAARGEQPEDEVIRPDAGPTG